MVDEIYFSVAECEILRWMTNDMGLPYITAVEKVVQQKRELAFIHGQRGNYPLQRQLLKEINEWTDELEQRFQEMQDQEQTLDKQIILPSGFTK